MGHQGLLEFWEFFPQVMVQYSSDQFILGSI